MKQFNLVPICDNAKSFYGKAIVIQKHNGDLELKSYETIVARVSEGKLYRLWDGYSATTMRHIKSFCELCRVDHGDKKWWTSLEVVK